MKIFSKMMTCCSLAAIGLIIADTHFRVFGPTGITSLAIIAIATGAISVMIHSSTRKTPRVVVRRVRHR